MTNETPRPEDVEAAEKWAKDRTYHIASFTEKNMWHSEYKRSFAAGCQYKEAQMQVEKNLSPGLKNAIAINKWLEAKEKITALESQLAKAEIRYNDMVNTRGQEAGRTADILEHCGKLERKLAKAISALERIREVGITRSEEYGELINLQAVIASEALDGVKE